MYSLIALLIFSFLSVPYKPASAVEEYLNVIDVEAPSSIGLAEKFTVKVRLDH